MTEYGYFFICYCLKGFWTSHLTITWYMGEPIGMNHKINEWARSVQTTMEGRCSLDALFEKLLK